MTLEEYKEKYPNLNGTYRVDIGHNSGNMWTSYHIAYQYFPDIESAKNCDITLVDDPWNRPGNRVIDSIKFIDITREK